MSPIHYDSSASTTAMTGKGIPPKLNFVNLQLTTCKISYNLQLGKIPSSENHTHKSAGDLTIITR